MKIAIIGGGISGLVCARHLHSDHDVSVFEANGYPGGHTNTVDVKVDDGEFAIDTGFIVFNDRTYPNFIELLGQLDVDFKPTIMSFSMKCESTGLEYRGADFKGLFAQKRNLVNPRFWRLLYDMVKFNRDAAALLPAPVSDRPKSADQTDYDEQETLRSFVERHRYSKQFVEQFLLPMGSAIWSCPFDLFEQFPAEFIAEFYHNHGLLSVTNRPQWYVVNGGSRQYVRKLIRPFESKLRLNCPVTRIVRDPESSNSPAAMDAVDGAGRGVIVESARGSEHFDHVIVACHADQAMRMLGSGLRAEEQEILQAFPYNKNVATLHTQADILPRARNAWASWNYFNPDSENAAATVTYNMNILQSIESRHVFNVTLNDNGRIRDENILEQFVYHHPVFDLRRKKMQRRHRELIGNHGVSFCGAYWGNGFHEDGVNSALAVVRWFRESSPPNAREPRLERST